MANENFLPGGCTIPVGGPGGAAVLPSVGDSGGIAALGGLVQAALNGKLGETLLAMAKQKAIGAAKQAATAALMKIFTVKAKPKPPKPPWVGLGKIAPPGSAAAASAMAAYNSAHTAPPIGPNAGTGAGGGGGPGGGGSGAAGSGHPKGSKATFEEWRDYLRDEYPDWWKKVGTEMNCGNYAEPRFNPPGELYPWLGGDMEHGYTALWGAITLGSPKYPGAGITAVWWVPDSIFGYDMSPYFTTHDDMFDRKRELTDLGAILNTELTAFLAGIREVKDPIHAALQIVYSGATTIAGLTFATINTLRRLFGLPPNYQNSMCP